MSSTGHRTITVVSEDRKFDVSIEKYDNGFFISIFEGSKKLGATIMSIGTGPSPSSSTIIPIRDDAVFLKLVSQKIASEFRGICIVSLSVQKELGSSAGKVLIEKITEAVRE
ncbi:MAG: hypothetical protein QXY22_02060 [Candidatus Nitrosotenuis sp.]|uniref:Proteasome assembly chaperone 3 n=1 Tax=Candidatus Nitrosotenuis uzonensis TaxID=1407055 RepID=V6AV05_9ARCH|nr:hypothetical protein [Candidatus Nitrosotenuis uzonensis]CDI06400.1 conserved hypothetical protein [Candidatus Nitrosotenuis uzonensis]